MPVLGATARQEAERRHAWIDDLPYVTDTLALPDLHMKPGMEAPSSLVVAMRDTIVPHLVSESINDGMGVVATPLTIDDVSVDALAEVLRWCNRWGARDKATPSPYSWTPELLEAGCRSGAAPLVEHYDLPDQFLDGIEDRGVAGGRPRTEEEYRDAVPQLLERTSLTRSEIGLNFGGNHFLEIQVVDDVVDDATLERFGLRRGQVLVMYHLGPGPLGSMLSNLHAYRDKPQPHRKAGYYVGRHLVHGRKGREHHRAFTARDRWLTLDPSSPPGRTYANALAVIENYGFAYRTGTMRAIVDAVHRVTGAAVEDHRLVVDMSHNILRAEEVDGEPRWVSRHNCCRPVPGMAGIVAGSYNVSSALTVGPADCDRGLGGYDHGVGYLIERAVDAGTLPEDAAGRTVRRLRMTRGTDQTELDEDVALLERTPLDEALTWLASQGMTVPVAYLRPVATLKHTT